MTSKIDSLGTTVAVSVGGAGKTAADRPATTSVASAAPAAPVDKISLTGDAVRMQQLDKAVAKGPDFDSGRVASTKAAIAAGRYQPDVRAIAARLARFEWEMRE